MSNIVQTEINDILSISRAYIMLNNSVTWKQNDTFYFMSSLVSALQKEYHPGASCPEIHSSRTSIYDGSAWCGGKQRLQQPNPQGANHHGSAGRSSAAAGFKCGSIAAASEAGETWVKRGYTTESGSDAA
jgi:hypothetical protein